MVQQNLASTHGLVIGTDQSSPMYDILRPSRSKVDKALDRIFNPLRQYLENDPPFTFSPEDQGLLFQKTLSESPIEAQGPRDKGKGILLDLSPTFNKFQRALKPIITRSTTYEPQKE